MLENLYTTKMSANKKALQSRFSKIRSKSGRLSKMMALVMSIAIAVTMLCATVVMAAIGSDGLEYWDKNEIYFRDGIDFSINLYNQDVPEWLKYNISGENDLVNFKIRNYEVRYADGIVNYGGFAEISGELGTYIFPAQGSIGLPDGIFSTLYSERDLQQLFDSTNAAYFTGLSFTTGNGSGHIITSNLVVNEYSSANNVEIGIGENFEILFGFSEDNQLVSVGCSFQHNVNRFHYLTADMTSIKMIGDIKSKLNDEWLLAPAGGAFTSFEKSYTNRNSDDIKINIKSATKDEIILNVSNKLEGNYRINIDVCRDDSDKVIGTERTIGSGEIAVDWREPFTPKSGDVCRISLYITDENSNKVVYRWQDYVTIQ